MLTATVVTRNSALAALQFPWDPEMKEDGRQKISHCQCLLVMNGANLRLLVKWSMAIRRYQFPLWPSGKARDGDGDPLKWCTDVILVHQDLGFRGLNLLQRCHIVSITSHSVLISPSSITVRFAPRFC
jgi:hypothetical protein